VSQEHNISQSRLIPETWKLRSNPYISVFSYLLSPLRTTAHEGGTAAPRTGESEGDGKGGTRRGGDFILSTGICMYQVSVWDTCDAGPGEGEKGSNAEPGWSISIRG